MIKKKMFILLGILTLFLIPFISAEYDWLVYGGDFLPAWNTQYQGTGAFDEGTSSYDTFSFGMDSGLQPLVARLNYTEEKEFIILQDGTSLEVLDGSDLSLASEISTYYSSPIYANPVVIDWDRDGFKNDIANIYAYNFTTFIFKVYRFNNTGADLTLIYEKNFSTYDSTYIGGMKQYQNGVYFIFQTNVSGGSRNYNLTFINSTYEKQIIFPSGVFVSNALPIRTPLGFWWMDSDNKLDFVTYTERETVVFDEDGTEKFRNDFGGNFVGGEAVFDSKIFAPNCDISWWEYLFGGSPSCPIEWRVLVLTSDGLGGTGGSMDLQSYKLDGTKLWEHTISNKTGSASLQYAGKVSVVDDYDGDGINDIFAIATTYDASNDFRKCMNFLVIKSDGTFLKQKEYCYIDMTIVSSTLTVADMNGNGYDDFVASVGNRVFVYEPTLDILYLNETSNYIDANRHYCIPADSNRDGLLEVVCSNASGTVVFASLYENQNAYANSFIYDPSTVVTINQTLNIIASATDPEGDPIYYKYRCRSTDSYNDTGTNNVFMCSYDSVGSYQFSAGVRDFYHEAYTVYNQTITVTESGTICDGDLVCEASQGENYLNCPSDCPIPEDTTTAEGGITIPTQLVDPDNTEQGLLPEVYYGTLGFFSLVLEPVVIIVFLIFSALILLTIGIIVKKIAIKVSNM